MTEVEGLWTAEVQAVGGWTGSGVIVLRDGKMLGGGNSFFFVGTYEVRGGKLEGEGRSFHYQGPFANAFGDTAPDFRFRLSGRLRGEDIAGKVHRAERPDLVLRMTRRAGFDGQGVRY